MKLLVLSLLASLVVLNLDAQNPDPTPGPEHKKLELFAGDWTLSGTAQAGPMGPGGEFKGTLKNRMILNGFFLQTEFEIAAESEDNDAPIVAIEIYGYDSPKKTYTFGGYYGDGTSVAGSLRVNGNTWKILGPFPAPDGKLYQARSEMVFSADGHSATTKNELSTDGKTWQPWSEWTATKVEKAR